MPNQRSAVEQLNIGLMVVACGAAFAAPFHLFLFAYAVLGPLHYLTEISWLHDHDYFAPRRMARRSWLALVAMAMLVLVFGYVSNDLLDRPVAPTFEIAMVYLVFATAPILLWVRHPVNAGMLVLVSMAAVAVFSNVRAYALLAYFIITIIHVLIFTAAFIVYGALKAKSRAALLSLGVYAACVAALFLWTPSAALAVSEPVRRTYEFFEPLNVQLMALFGFRNADVYTSAAGLAIMRFVAFAYTYHYLNWFSKTSIIGWHHVSRGRVVAIFGIWVAAMAIYLHDYATGVAVLYILSLLHVLLEFPLNHKTFAGIGTELMKGVRS